MAISLSDAARMLELDPAVLRRWLRREGIELHTHPTDHRQRMISKEDFERLRRERENTLAPATPAAGGSAGQPTGQLDVLRELLRDSLAQTTDTTNTHLTALAEHIAALQERIGRLEERLTGQLEERPTGQQSMPEATSSLSETPAKKP